MANKYYNFFKLAISFLIGVILGSLTLSSYSDSVLMNATISHSLQETVNSFGILKMLRGGKVDESIVLLEIQLNSGLVGLQDYDQSKSFKKDETLINMLKEVKKYRLKYPRTTDHVTVDDAVNKILLQIEKRRE